MKNLLFIGLFWIVTLHVSAQKTPTGIPFQGIAKDYNGTPANERKLFIQTNLIAVEISGKSIYTEVHETFTDAFGVFSIMIGNGKRTEGKFTSLNDISWEDGPYFLGIQMAIIPNAPIQNWQYQDHWINMGTTSFGIVPYAFYALQTSGLELKLSSSDTAQMLGSYVKNQVIKLLDSAISSKLSAKDTIAMLAPYTKVATVETNLSSLSTSQTNTIQFSGEYDSLKNKPILFSKEYDSLKNKPTLFSSEYDSLKNKPILFSSEYDSLKNKPTLFSKEYDSLKNKPILFSWAYNDLIGKPSLFSGSFTDLTNKPILNLEGDITNSDNITTLANSGVASGTYGSGLAIPILTIDQKGRITSVSTNTIHPNSFPNKTNTEKNAMPNTTSTGTVIWCSNCGSKGQMQVYNGSEWTDMSGADALTNGIIFGSINTSNIGSTTASITTTINNDGGNAITDRGIVWGININPTIVLSTKTNSGTSTGTFIASISGLTASTVYYTRTYATNSNGTLYGNEISFTTNGIIPTLTTSAASSISVNGFTIGGTISSDGGNLVIYRGICWSKSTNPTINDNKILSGTSTGTFTITLANLNTGTTYYVRAFATNSAGTAYGNESINTTSSLTVGTPYLGGKIVYLFQSGDAGYIAGEKHGFIVMNHSMGMQAAYGGFNSSTGYFNYSNSSMNFGTGRANTLLLYNMTGINAAKYIYNVNYDDYNDWYIPSYAEWNKIGPNFKSIGITTGSFQCSSETGQSNSFYYYVYMSYGTFSYSMGNSGKTSTYDIIGIRNF